MTADNRRLMIATPRAWDRHTLAWRCLDRAWRRVVTPQQGVNATRSLSDGFERIDAHGRIGCMANSPGQLRLALDDKSSARLSFRTSRQGHGSRACYLAGCREPLCIRANASYQRDYRNKLRGSNAHRMGGYRLADVGQ